VKVGAGGVGGPTRKQSSGQGEGKTTGESNLNKIGDNGDGVPRSRSERVCNGHCVAGGTRYKYARRSWRISWIERRRKKGGLETTPKGTSLIGTCGLKGPDRSNNTRAGGLT